MIALLCSVQAEAELLLAKTVVTGTSTHGSKTIIAGTLAGRRVLLCVGGMGKVNAAHAATLMINEFGPGGLIVFGVGGAYPSTGASVGDVALATEEISGDDGVVTRDGFKDTEHIGIPLARSRSGTFFNSFPAAPLLVERARQALSANGDVGKLHVGRFVTVSTCTGTSARARELEARYHGLCENMEGAAAAQVAALHDAPWLEVRGISNVVEDRDLAAWDIPRAAVAAQKAVMRLLEGWET